MAALDSTIITTLVAPISTSFSSFSALSWLASAYIIANAACPPLSGRPTDIFSRRSGLLFSNIVFGIGTLICGLSISQGMIIAGRVIAGMGGGGLGAISTFVASDLIPLRRRGLWQGIGNICWGLGSGIGGLFGGWVNDIWGWRWAFLSQVPFMFISALLVFFRLRVPVKSTTKPSLKQVDFQGASTLVSALVLLLFGLNAGGNTVPWTHPLFSQPFRSQHSSSAHSSTSIAP
jgi:MFS family permease